MPLDPAGTPSRAGIQAAIAEALAAAQARVKSGKVNATATATGTAGITDVTFSSVFNGVPNISVTPEDGSPSGTYLGISMVTAGGFRIHCTAPTNVVVHWIAVGPA